MIAGTVVVTMFDYLEAMIVKCAKDMKNSRFYYPGNNQLFKVAKDSPRLLPEDMDIFHRYIAILLFANKWARPDLQMYVTFLCTRVKSPTEQDHTKLGKVIGYLKDTVQLSLLVGRDDNEILTWNIYVSFAVHPDCKSHIGTCLTSGYWSLLYLSSKQKINTKSSSEAGLTGVDDTMTFVMLMKHLF